MKSQWWGVALLVVAIVLSFFVAADVFHGSEPERLCLSSTRIGSTEAPEDSEPHLVNCAH